MNDLSWIVTILPWPAASAQCLSIGLAVLSDTGKEKLFQPWVGWYNVFCAISFITGTGLIFVTTGPFAWNSVFPFWYAGIVFFVWFFVMHFALMKAIKKDVPAPQL